MSDNLPAKMGLAEVQTLGGPRQVYVAINAITEALSREGIGKDRRNEQQGFAFRGIDDVYNALAGGLAKHKLCIIPRMIERTSEQRQTAKGGIMYSVTVCVEFDFISAVDNSRHTCRMYGEAMDSGDKATNKAMSAAFKYACLQTFCIPTEGETPDADAHTPEPTVKAMPPKPAPPPAPVPARRVEEARPLPAPLPDIEPRLAELYAQATGFAETVAIVTGFKGIINELVGSEADYYRIINSHGMQHGNELQGKTRGQIRKVIKALYDYCTQVASPPPPPETEENPAWEALADGTDNV